MVGNATDEYIGTWSPPSLWLQNGVIVEYVVQYGKQVDANNMLDCSRAQSLFLQQTSNKTRISLVLPDKGSVYLVSVGARTSAGVGVYSECAMLETPAVSSTSLPTTAIGIGAGVGGVVVVLVVVIVIVVLRRQRRNKIEMAHKYAPADDSADVVALRGMMSMTVF
jgi:hypothetical protein